MSLKRKTQIMISIIILIILVSSFLFTSYIIQKNNQPKPNGCFGPTMFINSFEENKNITQNNGGWKINIVSGCQETVKWTDTTISIYPNNILNMKVIGINQYTANFTHTLIDKSELLIYASGNIFLNHNFEKISIDQFDTDYINISEIESLENVSFVVRETKPDNKDIINSQDTLFIFRDINGDKINEFPSNIRVDLLIKDNAKVFATGYLQ